MSSAWPDLGSPTSGDGIVLSAILGRLDDIYKLLDDRLPQPTELQVEVTVPELRKVQEPAPEVPPAVVEQVTESDDPAPPRGGPRGSTEAWLAWAQRRGVDVEPFQSRNQIIAACQRAGVLPG